MALRGPRVTSSTGVWHVVDDDSLNQRGVAGTVYDAFPNDGWVTRIEAFCRRETGGSSTGLYYAIWLEGAGGAPTERLGRTGFVTPTSSSAGSTLGANIVSADAAFSPSSTALAVRNGTRPVVGFRSDNGDIGFAVVGTNQATHYQRTVSSGYPTDPFTAASNQLRPTIALWIVYTENTAPTKPTGLAPAAGSFVNSTTPTFGADFNDVDEAAPFNDKLTAYRFELREAGATDLLWSNEYTASADERTAGRITRPYDGAVALIAGRSYEWRVQTADWFGAYGPFSDWTVFTVNAAGIVTLDGAPFGKVESATVSPYEARWHHPAGLGMARSQRRLLQNGQVIFTASEVVRDPAIASSALPGTLFTTATAQTLTPGTDYEYQVRGLDTNGLWSPWSEPRAFRTNAPPSIPSRMQPPSGAAATVRPLLEFVATDPDDDESTGLATSVRIKASNGSVLATVTPTRNPLTGLWEFQVTSTEVTGFGTFKWDANATDGTYTTTFSKEQTFVYASGPVPVVTVPAQRAVLTTSTPRIAWTGTGQVKYQVVVYHADTTRVAWDSRVVTSTVQDVQVLAGYLKNLGNYDAVVSLFDINNVRGDSLRIPFRIQYEPARALTAPAASPVRNQRDVEPTSIEMTWGLTDYSPGIHGGYLVWVREEGQDEDDSVLLRHVTSAGQTRWTDHHAKGSTPLVYSVAQLIRIGADTIQSPRVDAPQVVLELSTVVVASALDGGSRRAVLRWEPASRGVTYRQDQVRYDTWDDGPPFALVMPGASREASGSFRIIADNLADARAHFEDLESLFLSGDPVSYRDDRATKFFGQFDSFDRTDERQGRYGVRFRIAEVAFREGEDPTRQG